MEEDREVSTIEIHHDLILLKITLSVGKTFYSNLI